MSYDRRYKQKTGRQTDITTLYIYKIKETKLKWLKSKKHLKTYNNHKREERKAPWKHGLNIFAPHFVGSSAI